MSQSDSHPGPSKAVLWTMRGLALAGIAVGGFLLYLDIGYLIARETSKVPFCSWAPWLDCSAVIFHPKWSHWFGVPVAVFGVFIYVIALGILLTLRSDRPAGPRTWLVLHAIAIAIIGAAGWFSFVQFEKIGKVCQYCMIEHAIGVVLALMIIAHARRAMPTGRMAATFVAIIGVAVLAYGQIAYDPPMLEKVVIGKIDEAGKYIEPAANAKLLDGYVSLDAGSHLLIGPTTASRHIVAAIDYTCPHCKSLDKMFRDADEMLGPEYAIIILPYPISHHCNPIFAETGGRHKHACELARIAQTVWLVDHDAFPEFHRWLFDNQDDMTRDKALAHAKSLVDPGEFEGYRVDRTPEGDPQRLLARDIKIANRLGMKGRLPGLFVADSRFTEVPDDERQLVDLIHEALGQ